MLRINLLGSLEFHAATRDVTPTADKPRRLLALLALNHGRVMSLADLADELWDGDPPKAWKTAVQTYILQLRKLMAGLEKADHRGRHELLSTRPGGYALRLEGTALDADRFHDLYRAGVRASTCGDTTASESLAAAVGLWRGSALAGLDVGPQLRVEAARLNALRIAAIEAFCVEELSQGRHHELLADLVGHVTRYPTNETLCALYMRALYRANRRMQALQAFRDLDQAVRKELGLSPSIPLQRLHQAMLIEDPALDDAPLRSWKLPA
jgi:DNA-binding SARP family transcriptional activator